MKKNLYTVFLFAFMFYGANSFSQEIYISSGTTVYLGSSFQLTSGIVRNNGTFKINFENNFFGSSTQYVEGSVLVNNGGKSVTVPVGKGTTYSPVILGAVPTASATYTVEYFDTNSDTNFSHTSRSASFPAGDAGIINDKEYWDISSTNGVPVDVTFTYADAPVWATKTINETSIRVAHWDGVQWNSETANVNDTNNTVTFNATSFSPFSLFGADVTLSTDDNTFTSGFKMFPNPASSFLNISSSNNNILNYEIYDISGRLIKKENVENKNSQIFVNNLASGVYLIKFTESDSNKSFTKKLIIAH